MRKLQKRVVCLVERGWEGIRKLTISLNNEKIPSVCIIKGKLESEVLEMITKYDGISIKSISRGVFKLYILTMFLINFFLRNTICIVMDSEKNYSWVSGINRIFRIKTILLIKKGHDYTLFLNEKPQNISFILDLVKEQR